MAFVFDPAPTSKPRRWLLTSLLALVSVIAAGCSSSQDGVLGQGALTDTGLVDRYSAPQLSTRTAEGVVIPCWDPQGLPLDAGSAYEWLATSQQHIVGWAILGPVPSDTARGERQIAASDVETVSTIPQSVAPPVFTSSAHADALHAAGYGTVLTPFTRDGQLLADVFVRVDSTWRHVDWCGGGQTAVVQGALRAAGYQGGEGDGLLHLLNGDPHPFASVATTPEVLEAALGLLYARAEATADD